MATSVNPSINSCALKSEDPDILVVEPFYCGSHKQLVDCLIKDAVIGPRVHLVTMSGKKWHWRARVSALHLRTAIPVNHHFRVLFSSSVLNLTELVALRPDLAGLHKVLYFHENQLQYPVRKQKDRDFQYGYNQILSCLVADSVLFNSKFNMETFLTSINSFLKLMPDYRPKGLADTIRPKCSVLYFPMVYHNHSHYQLGHSGHAVGNRSKLQTRPASVALDGNLRGQQTTDAADSTFQAHQTALERGAILQADQEGNCCKAGGVANKPHLQDLKLNFHQADIAHQGSVCHNANLQADDTKCSGEFDSKLQADKGDDHDADLHADQTAGGFDVWCVNTRLVPPQRPSEPSANMKDERTCVSTWLEDSETGRVPDKRSAASAVTEDSGAQASDPPSRHFDLHCRRKAGSLHIVWPHRWEHDKDPETFFQALFRLQEEGLPFVVSVLGETFTDVPDIFAEAEKRLKDHIHAWGYQAEKSTYFQILQQADVVVSTSKHEFFGVAMLEAVNLGCYPLCPKSLVYPEIYPGECLYSTPAQLYKRLRSFCRHPHLARGSSAKVDVHRFSWENLRSQYLSKLQIKS